MEVFGKVTLRSSTEGYLYTFGFPIGVTNTTTHTLTSKTLDGLEHSVDRVSITEQDKVYLTFSMRNPALFGIMMPSMDGSTPRPLINFKIDMAKHSGLPSYQLYNKIWLLDSLKIHAAPILEYVAV